MRQVGNGRYQLVRELGCGGMGAVWLGQDTMLGREVAIKELMVPGGIPADERAVYQERVLREARIASRLADPAVVTVYDLIKEYDQTYIVMELIRAPTLTDLVAGNGPLGPKAAATLAQQLLAALEAAHESGVVHRDVKPGNVMVPAKGTAKLTDFGIAQSLDDPRLTASGYLIGSPAYMSPERLDGGPPSPAWDLWALGATLFFATEGYGPYERDTTSATMLAVMTERPRPQLSQGPMAELIFGLLEPDPELRLTTPRAHRLIERALSSTAQDQTGFTEPVEQPTVRTPPVSRPTLTPLGRKRRRARILSMTLTPLFVVGAVVLLYFTVFKPMITFGAGSGPLTTPDGPASSAAMQPVLTLGPEGDIKDTSLRAFRHDCLNWLPAKDAPKIDSKAGVGCYGPHDVEVLDTVSAGTDPEQDVAYPSVEQLAKLAGTQCTKTFFSDKVKGANKETTLRYWVIVPTAEAWKVRTNNGYRSSSRIMYCFVGRADGGKLTEPVMAD